VKKAILLVYSFSVYQIIYVKSGVADAVYFGNRQPYLVVAGGRGRAGSQVVPQQKRRRNSPDDKRCVVRLSEIALLVVVYVARGP
jgi:hypothetical protein